MFRKLVCCGLFLLLLLKDNIVYSKPNKLLKLKNNSAAHNITDQTINSTVHNEIIQLHPQEDNVSDDSFANQATFASVDPNTNEFINNEPQIIKSENLIPQIEDNDQSVSSRKSDLHHETVKADTQIIDINSELVNFILYFVKTYCKNGNNLEILQNILATKGLGGIFKKNSNGQLQPNYAIFEIQKPNQIETSTVQTIFNLEQNPSSLKYSYMPYFEAKTRIPEAPTDFNPINQRINPRIYYQNNLHEKPNDEYHQQPDSYYIEHLNGLSPSQNNFHWPYYGNQDPMFQYSGQNPANFIINEQNQPNGYRYYFNDPTDNIGQLPITNQDYKIGKTSIPHLQYFVNQQQQQQEHLTEKPVIKQHYPLQQNKPQTYEYQIPGYNLQNPEFHIHNKHDTKQIDGAPISQNNIYKYSFPNDVDYFNKKQPEFNIPTSDYQVVTETYKYAIPGKQEVFLRPKNEYTLPENDYTKTKYGPEDHFQHSGPQIQFIHDQPISFSPKMQKDYYKIPEQNDKVYFKPQDNNFEYTIPTHQEQINPQIEERLGPQIKLIQDQPNLNHQIGISPKIHKDHYIIPEQKDEVYFKPQRNNFEFTEPEYQIPKIQQIEQHPGPQIQFIQDQPIGFNPEMHEDHYTIPEQNDEVYFKPQGNNFGYTIPAHQEQISPQIEERLGPQIQFIQDQPNLNYQIGISPEIYKDHYTIPEQKDEVYFKPQNNNFEVTVPEYQIPTIQQIEQHPGSQVHFIQNQPSLNHQIDISPEIHKDHYTIPEQKDEVYIKPQDNNFEFTAPEYQIPKIQQIEQHPGPHIQFIQDQPIGFSPETHEDHYTIPEQNDEVYFKPQGNNFEYTIPTHQEQISPQIEERLGPQIKFIQDQPQLKHQVDISPEIHKDHYTIPEQKDEVYFMPQHNNFEFTVPEYQMPKIQQIEQRPGSQVHFIQDQPIGFSPETHENHYIIPEQKDEVHFKPQDHNLEFTAPGYQMPKIQQIEQRPGSQVHFIQDQPIGFSPETHENHYIIPEQKDEVHFKPQDHTLEFTIPGYQIPKIQQIEQPPGVHFIQDQPYGFTPETHEDHYTIPEQNDEVYFKPQGNNFGYTIPAHQEQISPQIEDRLGPQIKFIQDQPNLNHQIGINPEIPKDHYTIPEQNDEGYFRPQENNFEFTVPKYQVPKIQQIEQHPGPQIQFIQSQPNSNSIGISPEIHKNHYTIPEQKDEVYIKPQGNNFKFTTPEYQIPEIQQIEQHSGPKIQFIHNQPSLNPNDANHETHKDYYTIPEQNDEVYFKPQYNNFEYIIPTHQEQISPQIEERLRPQIQFIQDEPSLNPIAANHEIHKDYYTIPEQKDEVHFRPHDNNFEFTVPKYQAPKIQQIEHHPGPQIEFIQSQPSLNPIDVNHEIHMDHYSTPQQKDEIYLKPQDNHFEYNMPKYYQQMIPQIEQHSGPKIQVIHNQPSLNQIGANHEIYKDYYTIPEQKDEVYFKPQENNFEFTIPKIQQIEQHPGHQIQFIQEQPNFNSIGISPEIYKDHYTIPEQKDELPQHKNSEFTVSTYHQTPTIPQIEEHSGPQIQFIQEDKPKTIQIDVSPGIHKDHYTIPEQKDEVYFKPQHNNFEFTVPKYQEQTIPQIKQHPGFQMQFVNENKPKLSENDINPEIKKEFYTIPKQTHEIYYKPKDYKFQYAIPTDEEEMIPQIEERLGPQIQFIEGVQPELNQININPEIPKQTYSRPQIQFIHDDQPEVSPEIQKEFYTIPKQTHEIYYKPHDYKFQYTSPTYQEEAIPTFKDNVYLKPQVYNYKYTTPNLNQMVSNPEVQKNYYTIPEQNDELYFNPQDNEYEYRIPEYKEQIEIRSGPQLQFIQEDQPDLNKIGMDSKIQEYFTTPEQEEVHLNPQEYTTIEEHSKPEIPVSKQYKSNIKHIGEHPVIQENFYPNPEQQVNYETTIPKYQEQTVPQFEEHSGPQIEFIKSDQTGINPEIIYDTHTIPASKEPVYSISQDNNYDQNIPQFDGPIVEFLQPDVQQIYEPNEYNPKGIIKKPVYNFEVKPPKDIHLDNESLKDYADELYKNYSIKLENLENMKLYLKNNAGTPQYLRFVDYVTKMRTILNDWKNGDQFYNIPNINYVMKTVRNLSNDTLQVYYSKKQNDYTTLKSILKPQEYSEITTIKITTTIENLIGERRTYDGNEELMEYLDDPVSKKEFNNLDSEIRNAILTYVSLSKMDQKDPEVKIATLVLLYKIKLLMNKYRKLFSKLDWIDNEIDISMNDQNLMTPELHQTLKDPNKLEDLASQIMQSFDYRKLNKDEDKKFYIALLDIPRDENTKQFIENLAETLIDQIISATHNNPELGDIKLVMNLQTPILKNLMKHLVSIKQLAILRNLDVTEKNTKETLELPNRRSNLDDSYNNEETDENTTEIPDEDDEEENNTEMQDEDGENTTEMQDVTEPNFIESEEFIITTQPPKKKKLEKHNNIFRAFLMNKD